MTHDYCVVHILLILYCSFAGFELMISSSLHTWIYYFAFDSISIYYAVLIPVRVVNETQLMDQVRWISIPFEPLRFIAYCVAIVQHKQLQCCKWKMRGWWCSPWWILMTWRVLWELWTLSFIVSPFHSSMHNITVSSDASSATSVNRVSFSFIVTWSSFGLSSLTHHESIHAEEKQPGW